MISSARILRQLLHTDRLFGVEAAPRIWFPGIETETAPEQAPPSPALIRKQVPGSPAPVRTAAQAAAPAWQITAEIPLAAPAAGEALAVLFVSIEWGNPLAGETRALFERQVVAMKLAPAQAGLLRMAWTGPEEPHTAALAQASARASEEAAVHQPRTVVLLGGFSLRAVAGEQLGGSLTAARGRWFDWHIPGGSIPACATWHPGQLGVDRDRRAQTWEDLKAVCGKLERK